MPMRSPSSWKKLTQRLTCRSQSLTLRWVLVGSLALPAILAIGLTGYLVFRNEQQTVRQQATGLLYGMGDRTRRSLQQQLQIPHLINQLNADQLQLGFLPGFQTTDTQPLACFFWQQIQRFPTIGTIAMANPQGGMVGSARMPNGKTGIYSTTSFRRGTLQATEGLTQCLPLPAGKGVKQFQITTDYDATQRDWYRTPVRAGRATWSAIYEYVSATPTFGISAGLPIYNPQEKLAGVLATDLTLDRLSAVLRQFQPGSGGRSFIVERSGLLVATSTQIDPFRLSNDHLKRLSAGGFPDRLISATADYLSDRTPDWLQTQTAETLEFEWGQEQQFVRLIPVQDPYGLDWLLVIVVPESTINSRMPQSTLTTLAMVLAGFLASLGLGWVITNWLARPILRLSQASRSLALGEWDYPIATNQCITELAILADSFNLMAQSLENAFDQVRTALQESEEKFAKVFRNSPDGIALVDCHSKCYLDVNQAFLTISGYQREELIGFNVTDFNLMDDPEQIAQVRQLLCDLQTALDRRQLETMRQMPIALRSRSGESRTVSIAAEFLDLEGKPSLLLLLRDITDLNRMATQVRRSEQMLQEAQRVSHVGSWEYEVQSETITWTAELKRIYGLDPDEPTPSVAASWQLIHPDDRVPYQQVLEQAIAQKQPYEYELRAWHQDGSLRYLSIRGEPLFDPQGQWVGMVGTTTDITDRKHLELALKQSESRLANILNSAIASITSLRLLADGTWEYEYQSAGCEGVFGYTAEAFLADVLLWKSRVHPDDWQRIFQPLLSNLKAEQKAVVEYRFSHKQGDWRWIEATYTSKWDETAHCWMVTIVSSDITHRRWTETALAQQNSQQNSPLRQLLKSEGVGVLVARMDGRILQANDRFLHMIGYDRSDLAAGRLRWDVMTPPEYMTLDRAAIAQMQAIGVVLPVEKEYLHKDGSRVAVCIGGIRFQEHPDQIMAVILDISPVKQMEQRLSQQVEQLRLMTDALPVYIAYLDAEQRYQFANRMYEVRFNCRREELYGKQMRDLLGEEAYEGIRADVESALAGTSTCYERTEIDQWGQQRHWMTHLLPDQTESGSVKGCYVLATEITERQQLELELQRSQAQLQDILNNAVAAIIRLRFYTPEDWEYVYVSPGSAGGLGYTPAQLMSEKDLWRSRIPLSDWETVILPRHAQIFAGQTTTIEYHFRDPHNRLRLICETLICRWDESAGCWIGTAVCIDLSHRRTALSRMPEVGDRPA